ncbi:MAG TPA: hypothetical protein VER55_09495, partial [Ardenticatenaceae bacterium]|nr:hypothetical protein [Ardenticatenaceae bacterium]
PATTFAPNVGEIFAVWSYANMPPGISYTRRWYRNGELWLEREEAWTRGTNGWVNDVSIYNRTPEGFQPGQYRLDLLIEGQVVQSGEFTIGSVP